MQEQRTVISPIVKISWVLFIPHFYRRCLFKCAEQRENIRSKRLHANAISSVYAIKLFNHNRMDLNARQPPRCLQKMISRLVSSSKIVIYPDWVQG